jgi:chromosome segregation protein
LYLKNLSLRGFKTFADKTVIEFNPPGSITGVVGPNGCGKSNLVDAIRWVLGEQNPKELRSSALEEVIFAGSSARKSLSLAEVSIELDNTDNKIKTEFSELSIKRRTFRSGESEFFINKANCRLKDIRDLFLDTGLGAGSYSIISQGQVDAILSSKPEERREIFEEAAKINKYKFRKTAAERKLISTEQNMLRIADLKSEIANQLATLEEQSKKASQFKELKEKLKTLEVGLSKKQIKNITEKKKTVDEKIASLRSQMELGLNLTKQHEDRRLLKKEEYRALNDEIEGLRLSISAAKLSYEENKSSILLEKEKKRNLEERIEEAQSHASELAAKLKLLDEKAKELEAEFRSASELKSKLESELVKLEQNANRLLLEQEKIDSVVNDLKITILEKESDLSNERNEMIELGGNLRHAKEEARHDEDFVGKLENERNDLIKKSGELKALLDTLGGRLNKKEGDKATQPSSAETLEALFKEGPVKLELLYGADIRISSVKLNSKLILSDGKITGGSLREKVSGIFEKEKEITTLIEHAKATQEAESVALEIKNNTEEIELIHKSLSARKKEIGDISARESSLKSDIKLLDDEAKQNNERLSSSQEKLKNIIKEKDDAASGLTESRITHAGVASRTESLRSELEKIKDEVRSINELISSRNRKEMKERLDLCASRIGELELSLPKLLEQERDITKKLGSCGAKRTVLEREIEEIEKLLAGGTSEDRVMRDALSKEEVAMAKLEGEVAAISEKMMNEYNMTVEEILASEYDIPITRSREEAESLRRSIADLGPVNLLATEEFAKARERFNFVETQYTDLTLARENLSNLIKELDEKAREEFIKTLKIINQNFSEIFAKLFEGGEAKLEIPEGVDILEGGIEIVARPGGKKWLNLSVMSGGERALTAIALLFALLKTHPSPFCLLDEADSALDESNVHRFTKMLKEFSLTTQVMLITHNKQTMEIVDTMYGITMEEPGVSKVVSVKLAKAA